MKTRVLLENCRTDPPSPGATRSILLEDGRIKRISDSPTQSVEGEVKRIDVQGCTVLPGLIDAHCHLIELGASRRLVDLRGTTSITSMSFRLYGRTSKAQPHEWIVGWGWDQEKFSEGRFPTRHDIDEITPDNPVLLTRVCGHVGLMNSRAMGQLQLDGNSSVSHLIERDEWGAPTGIVREDALALVRANLRSSLSAIEEDIVMAEYEALKNGITTAHCVLSENHLQEVQALTNLSKAGRLSLRYRLYLPISVVELVEKRQPELPTAGEKLRFSGIKLFADGSLGARTAALSEPYTDAPGNKGVLRYTDEELNSALLRVASLGMQAAVHAIGDVAVSQTLDAFAQAGSHPRDERWRIEHASVTPEEIRERMGKQAVCLALQPHFAASDTWAEKRLGTQRVRDLYTFRSLVRSGLAVAGGSDAPVEPISPILGMWAAMTRTCAGEDESLTLGEAIALYTTGPAHLSFDEKTLGAVEEGYSADLTILDADITEMHPAMLRRVNVATTIADGNIAYSYEGMT